MRPLFLLAASCNCTFASHFPHAAGKRHAKFAGEKAVGQQRACGALTSEELKLTWKWAQMSFNRAWKQERLLDMGLLSDDLDLLDSMTHLRP